MNLEDQLRRSFDDLDGALGQVPVGRFEPPPDRSGKGMAAAMAVLLLGGLALYVGTRSDGASKLDTAVDSTTAPTAVPTTGIVTTTIPSAAPTTAATTGGSDADPADVLIVPENPGEAYMPVNPGGGAWNADGSAVLLYRQGGGYLVVGPDGAPISELEVSARDIEQVFWDPKDPTTIWFPPPDSNTLTTVDAFSGQVTTDVITIDECLTLETSSLVGPNPALLEDGRSVFGLTCIQPGDRRLLLLIDLASGEQIGARPVPRQGSIALSRSGRFGVVHSDGLLRVFDAGFEDELFSVGLEPEFAVVNNSRLGEVVVGRRYDGESTGALLVLDLATGTERTIIGVDRGHGQPPPGLRMAVSPDGMVALRVPAESAVANDDLLQPGNVYVVDLTQAEPVAELAATSVNSADNEELGVWFRGHLSVNRAGTALAYSSDLVTADTDRVGTVIIPLTDR